MRNLVVLSLLLTFSFPSLAVSVGTIDIQKVLFTVKRGQKVRKQLETSFNKKKAALKKEEDKLKKSKEEFDKKAQLLSEQAKLKEQERLQRMLLALETKRQKYQKEIRDMEARLTEPIVKSIYQVAEGVAAKAKVDLAFESSASPIIYAATKRDLTDEVIKQYDKKHPK